jgi:hypothetical protein
MEIKAQEKSNWIQNINGATIPANAAEAGNCGTVDHIHGTHSVITP